MNIEHKFKELHELLLCAYDEDYEESLDKALKELDVLKKEVVKKLTIPVVSTTVTCEHVRGSVIVTDDLVELECRKCGKRY